MEVELNFAVSDNGNLTDLNITSSSGNSCADKVAIQAVELCKPLPAPPLKKSGFLHIQAYFNSANFDKGPCHRHKIALILE